MNTVELKPQLRAQRPLSKRARAAIASAMVTTATLGAVAPAHAAPSRPEAKPSYGKSAKTVKGALALIFKLAQNGNQLPIENRFNVIETSANPNDVNDVTKCRRTRVVAMPVGGYVNYFGFNVIDPKSRAINRNTLEVVPLGRANEVDREPNPQRRHFVFTGSGTQSKPNVSVSLEYGQLVAGGTYDEDATGQYGKARLTIGQVVGCVKPEPAPAQATPIKAPALS